MEHFEVGKLTGSGRADLGEGETQVAAAGGVSLQDRSRKLLPLPGAERGQAVVTTHSIWWWNDENKQPIKLGLQWLLKVEAHKSMFRREPRIDLYFQKDPSEPLLRLIFGSSRDCGEFYERLQTSLSRQGWKAPKTVVKRETEFKTQFAGIGGVMRRQEQEREQTQALTSEAFADLEKLMQSAGEIVALADRFSSAVQQQKSKKQGAVDSDEEEFYSLLNDMGIANPATKQACGSRYHEELAKELTDFLSLHLKRHSKSGVMALTDLYCLVNRARGTALISPNDLYQACALMQSLSLGYMLKRFPSGVCVVQPVSMSDETAAQVILDLLERQDASDESGLAFLTALQVAQELSLSTQLAMEQLQLAENMGLLCRDETYHGTAFFRNWFAQVHVQ